MSEKEDIQYHFGISVKNAAIDLANRIIRYPGNRRMYLNQFGPTLDNLVEKQDQALAKLETVKVKREHLQVLTDWFVKALKGYDRTDISTEDILGRNPRCFGTRTSSKTCGESELRIKGLCKACIAISPLLKDDC